MNNHIPISWLNDYVFCPYSIYLHNVYMGTEEGLYHATPQIQGRIAHNTIDNKTHTNKNTITALSVISNKLGLIGKIDIYKPNEKILIERKYKLKNIFRGHLYQLWSEYYCMIEMGYSIDHLEFYEMSSNRHIPIALPTAKDYNELITIIAHLHNYNPEQPIKFNINKCRHCIYCNLCDKIDIENVYT